jgi:NAD(P)-dependent dehydrogenase (short-subunit alcohol dehydrogenase family)
MFRFQANIVMWDIDQSELHKTVNHLYSSHRNPNKSKLWPATVDVSDFDAVRNHAAAALQKFGHFDVIINNAGIVSGKSMLQLKNSQLMNTFSVNALAPMVIIKSFLPSMMRRAHWVTERSLNQTIQAKKSTSTASMPSNLSKDRSDCGIFNSHIINVSSLAGQSYACYLADYCASKATLTSMHRSFCMELRRMREDPTFLQKQLNGSTEFNHEMDHQIDNKSDSYNDQSSSTSVVANTEFESKGNIYTTLVLPWHIDTDMFAGVANSIHWLVRILFPPLSKVTVAQKIVASIRSVGIQSDCISNIQSGYIANHSEGNVCARMYKTFQHYVSIVYRYAWDYSDEEIVLPFHIGFLNSLLEFVPLKLKNISVAFAGGYSGMDSFRGNTGI